jgi:DNA polymerase III epsilon subunit-like protein
VIWPSGEELLDVLVRPLGAVLDLNSRFSGVRPEHYRVAIPYKDWIANPPTASEMKRSSEFTDATKPPAVLPIVESPALARTLLCSFITPQTPLIGHAIDNDLTAVRLCHPTIVDTVILFPHPRGPLPRRLGLKALTGQHLGRNIQMGGADGHDSLEDARATGDLVRFKVRQVAKLKGMHVEKKEGGKADGKTEKPDEGPKV